jgi:hypothetical protein
VGNDDIGVQVVADFITGALERGFELPGVPFAAGPPWFYSNVDHGLLYF